MSILILLAMEVIIFKKGATVRGERLLKIESLTLVRYFYTIIDMKVLILGDALLRQKALPVEDINDEIRFLIAQMFETMHEQNGIGLAGPQVGKGLRLFIVELDDEVQRVFINPQIIATSAQTSMYEEGCLSIPGIYEEIERPIAVTVQAFSEDGKAFSLEAEDLLARAIQHEYDHLEGILYIDRGEATFKQKTIETFKKRDERRRQKVAEKKAKAAKIAVKIAKKGVNSATDGGAMEFSAKVEEV